MINKNQPPYVLAIHYWAKEAEAYARGLESECWRYETLREFYFELAGIKEDI